MNKIICITTIMIVFPVLGHAQPFFLEISEFAGVQFSLQGRGVCVLDINNDSLDDFFVCNHAGDDLLFLNNGNFQFTDISDESGISGTGASQVAVAADYDADGYVDLFVGVTNSPSKLYRNNGDNSFTDTTLESGITYSGNILGAAWGDYNLDGWIDLYIANFNARNYLFENYQGVFTDVTFAVNAQGPMNDLCMMAMFLDYDGDGDVEIIGTQDGYRGNYLLTMQPDNMYSDIADLVNIRAEDVLQGMGVMTGDFNRDGFLDLYFTNLNENLLFRQEENGAFTNVSTESGAQDQPMSMAWGSSFFDADNDGWPDIFSNNESGFGGIPTSFFYNHGDGTFSDEAIVSGLYLWNSGYGCAVSDFDNDGDVDLIVVGYDVENGILLFDNQSPQKNWLQFNLSGNPPNTFALGTTAILWVNGELQKKVIQAGSGFCSQDSYVMNFGIGEATSADSLVVQWPSARKTYYPMDINHIFSIDESQNCIPYGEVTGDQAVDVLDIVAVVAFIMGTTEFELYQECQADINMDEYIDVADIVMIISGIL